ncbi:helix-turn-helix domain-containing protein [Lysobacter sp. S4-A87]|uniref:helix-turn-helix domain-containing protein n=1 Tax=Lysobacter sp. S4-A87 TaxID=2925843 RepID=UPI001F52D972|nr:helix-turn-helix domain-containing protein [Lysobacter sp. S4-A87]UNK49822.1 helix-turn-helix domain-containing protein [Lysobacter sp. S4-A87]
MLGMQAVQDDFAIAPPNLESPPSLTHCAPYLPGLEALVAGLPLLRRRVRARQYLFRAGQPRNALYLVHAGFFKTRILSDDGREKITGFRLRGDLLGMDALDMPRFTCDAIALDVGEVWELPCGDLRERLPQFQEQLTAMLASEIRRDWKWMLVTGSLNADQRVVSFLLDLSTRLEALGFSASSMFLRMTRADVGNFLSIQLETVVRALTRLQARGLIGVDRREIRILDAAGLRASLSQETTH